MTSTIERCREALVAAGYAVRESQSHAGFCVTAERSSEERPLVFAYGRDRASAYENACACAHVTPEE